MRGLKKLKFLLTRSPKNGDRAITHNCFFFNDTATTEIYTLSLHDALPISSRRSTNSWRRWSASEWMATVASRSEEHTSELQSRRDLVCRLLLEKKKEK